MVYLAVPPVGCDQGLSPLLLTMRTPPHSLPRLDGWPSDPALQSDRQSSTIGKIAYFLMRGKSVRYRSAVVSTAVAGCLALLTFWQAASAHAQSTSGAPCGTSFNPFDYSAAADAACGLSVFPREKTIRLRDGGMSYYYDVDGTQTVYNVPPKGFNFSTASSAELKQYGIPPKPMNPKALANWKHMLSHLHIITPPPFIVVSNVASGNANPHRSGQMTTSGSTSADTNAESTARNPLSITTLVHATATRGQLGLD